MVEVEIKSRSLSGAVTIRLQIPHGPIQKRQGLLDARPIHSRQHHKFHFFETLKPPEKMIL